MLELKTKQALAKEAITLACSSELVRYLSTTYLPVDFETGESDVVPDPERTIWLPLTPNNIRQMAANQFDTLFANDGELRSFNFMVAQSAIQHHDMPNRLLVRTPKGLRVLDQKGKLVKTTGEFIPNTLKPMLNDDAGAKKSVLSVIEEWLDSEEEAESLLKHLATSLSPGWSAVKYVLLLGEGRNGKGLLLKMLEALFGWENISNVTRQKIAEESAVVAQLNGKLLNIVYDGQAAYVKDSGTEKTLIAGEPASIEMKYESVPTKVQTNALFLESLNREPKSSDKSSALQKRLVRFQFPHVYALDHAFEREMLKDETIGAFLSLLVDHFVHEDLVAKALAPTTKAVELQLEHMYINSTAMQFIKHLEDTDPVGATCLLGEPVDLLVSMFQSWRIKENDLATWAEPDVLAQFLPLLNTERKSVRGPTGPRKIRRVTSFKDEAAAFIATLKEDTADDDLEALVAD